MKVHSGTWRLGIATVVIAWSTLTCALPHAPAPSPTLNKIINKGEYFLEGTAIVVNGVLPQYWGAANAAFGQAAAVAFQWAYEGTESPPSNGWPSPESGQPGYNAGWSQIYIDYARTRRDSTVSFGAFWVSGPGYTQTCQTPRVLGITYRSTWNQVPSDVRIRFSFFFWDRADYAVTNCLTSNRDYFFNHLVTHELGHQRAGLTHTDSNPPYHGGVLPSGRLDVMLTAINTTDLRFQYPVFDKSPLDGCDTGTCGGNLQCWRSISN